MGLPDFPQRTLENHAFIILIPEVQGRHHNPAINLSTIENIDDVFTHLPEPSIINPVGVY
jgi:hypothetical protein